MAGRYLPGPSAIGKSTAGTCCLALGDPRNDNGKKLTICFRKSETSSQEIRDLLIQDASRLHAVVPLSLQSPPAAVAQQ